MKVAEKILTRGLLLCVPVFLALAYWQSTLIHQPPGSDNRENVVLMIVFLGIACLAVLALAGVRNHYDAPQRDRWTAKERELLHKAGAPEFFD